MANKTGLPGSAEPWGRAVDKRLGELEHRAGITSTTLEGLQSSVDKTVFAAFDYGQNIANGVNAKLTLDWPVEVQFVSSTGMFEVTVSASGLVMAGASLGISFESDEWPSDIYFDIPARGVVASCAEGDVRYAPFAGSRSTLISTRPGIFNLSLYAFANTTINASAQAFIHEAQLSVKAV